MAAVPFIPGWLALDKYMNPPTEVREASSLLMSGKRLQNRVNSLEGNIRYAKHFTPPTERKWLKEKELTGILSQAHVQKVEYLRPHLQRARIDLQELLSLPEYQQAIEIDNNYDKIARGLENLMVISGFAIAFSVLAYKRLYSRE